MQSAVPYKKEASVVGMTAATASSSMIPAELTDDYGVCVICAEQRQVIFVPAVRLTTNFCFGIGRMCSLQPEIPHCFAQPYCWFLSA